MGTGERIQDNQGGVNPRAGDTTPGGGRGLSRITGPIQVGRVINITDDIAQVKMFLVVLSASDSPLLISETSLCLYVSVIDVDLHVHVIIVCCGLSVFLCPISDIF